MFLELALNEDGTMPGEPLGFLEGFIWFFVAPVSIVLFIWVAVVALENVQKSKKNRIKQDLITRRALSCYLQSFDFINLFASLIATQFHFRVERFLRAMAEGVCIAQQLLHQLTTSFPVAVEVIMRGITS